MAQVGTIKTFGAMPTGLTGVDSITTGDGSVFVEYGNGATSTGGKGSSTIIQYNQAGTVQHTYEIAGSVDGLKYNPTTGKVWALQNQDGNSTLSLIDPNTHTVSAPIKFANASATRGYDDVVFEGNKVFLSYTNPSTDANPKKAPTVVELIGGESALGKGPLITQPILTTASTGVNTVTGKTEVVPQTDPDSLKSTANGDLLFTNADGGVITEIHNPGRANQSASFTQITVNGVKASGLDDVIKTDATSGTFTIADQTGDRVQTVHVDNLNPNDFYASVGNAFGQVDPKTGAFTALVSTKNDPGFGSSHGVSFKADPVAPAPKVSDIKTFGATPVGLTKPDSITMGANGTTFVEYGNGADSTGAGGSSTIIQYDKAGTVQYTYDIAGSVDGLKYNPTTGKVWALQNQDGNSTLSLIDPNTHTVSAPIKFANASATRGYDDVVFEGSKVFLSYTNPSTDANPTKAATVVELIGGESALGKGDLLTMPILTTASMGLNTVTGKMALVPQTDPDSLKTAPNGDLIFSSADGGVITQIHNPGAANQSVSFTQIKIPGTTSAFGLDDVIKTDAKSGTFTIADATGDRVQTFHVSNLNPNDFYASVGNAFGQVDPKTGTFTALVSSKNDPGFGSAHGIGFTADTSSKVASAGSAGATSPANQAALLSDHIAAAFATPAVQQTGNIATDPHGTTPVVVKPTHHA